MPDFDHRQTLWAYDCLARGDGLPIGIKYGQGFAPDGDCSHNQTP